MKSPMQFSDNGCACLEESEGKVSVPYKDSEGNRTIGIGHLIKKGEKFSMLTDREIYDLLKKDVAIAADAVNRLVKVPLTQNQFDALVCLVFNIGEGNFEGSGLLRVLNQGNYADAANRFPKWNKERISGVLVESKGLSARRGREQALFLKGA